MIRFKRDQSDQIAPWLHACLCVNISSDYFLLESVFPTNVICLCSQSPRKGGLESHLSA